MQVNNIGYNHSHDADFQISRPDGSGDYLFLIVKTPAIFTLSGKDIQTEPNSVILYKKGTPQFYRVLGTVFTNDWLHFDINEDELSLFEEWKIPFDTILPLNNINDLSLFIKNIGCFAANKICLINRTGAKEKCNNKNGSRIKRLPFLLCLHFKALVKHPNKRCHSPPVRRLHILKHLRRCGNNIPSEPTRWF